MGSLSRIDTFDTQFQESHSSHVDPRAPIERLPVELLQKIFFYNLEFNFPRASIHIASALSNETLYTWLIRAAFSSPNPSSSSGIFVHPFIPLEYLPLSTHRQLNLQTEILRCQWCTFSLMRRCQRSYVEHVLRQKCSHLILSDADRARLDNLEDFWSNLPNLDRNPQGHRSKGDLVLPAKHPETGASLKIAIWFNSAAVQIRGATSIFQETDIFRLPYCDPIDTCRMPDRLLCAPWTDEKLELLQIFSNEAYVDLDNRCERSKSVLRQLIIDRDFETFKKLLKLHIRVRVYAFSVVWPVRANHFRTAARCALESKPGKYDDPFLKLLFTNYRDQIPRSDQAILKIFERYEENQDQEDLHALNPSS